MCFLHEITLSRILVSKKTTYCKAEETIHECRSCYKNRVKDITLMVVLNLAYFYGFSVDLLHTPRAFNDEHI